MSNSSFDIFDFNVSDTGDCVVVVDAAGSARVLEIAKRRTREVGSVHWDTGGTRVAISSVHGVIVSGKFDGGIACYDSRSGETLWRDESVREVQSIEIDSARERCFVVQDDRPCLVIRLRDGTVIGRLGRCRRAFVDPANNSLFLAESKRIVCLRADDLAMRWHVDATVTLAAAGAADRVYVGTLAGPLMGIDAASGEVLWRHEAPGCQYSEIGSYDGSIYSLRTRYNDPAGLFLDRFSTMGEFLGSRPLGNRGAGRFVMDGQLLFMFNELIETRTGVRVAPIEW